MQVSHYQAVQGCRSDQAGAVQAAAEHAAGQEEGGKKKEKKKTKAKAGNHHVNEDDDQDDDSTLDTEMDLMEKTGFAAALEEALKVKKKK